MAGARRAQAAVVAIVLALLLVPSARATQLTVHTDQVLGSPYMGLGVELDPYDTLGPTQVNWSLIEQRLAFMAPGFLRVNIHVSQYFGGYDASNNPTYKWTNPQVEELITILALARNLSIPVVLGNWENPLLDGDARIPTDFLVDLRSTYGFTNIEYYDLENEPNDSATCAFSCWASLEKSTAAAFGAAGVGGAVKLVGPDNENSWDDDQPAAALDLSHGLDVDNPLGGDAWVTDTLQSIPSLIGAYDSHRYATIWGVENGIYGDQVRARRLEISNLDSPSKPYFDGEIGMTARQVSPFTSDRADTRTMTARLRAELDPSSVTSDLSTFVDDQPNITQFQYGTWMGDLIMQAIDGGLSGASAWDLDDAMHNGGGYGSVDLKQWGFWNSLAGQDGYPASDINLRPWYDAWSILSRAFPAGSQPLLTPSTGVLGLRVTAARIPDGRGYDLSLAVVDDSQAPQRITLTVPSVTGALTMAQYDYLPSGSPVDANQLPVPAAEIAAQPAAGIPLTVPAEGMIVLTSHGVAAPVKLNQATGFVDDHFANWGKTVLHTHQLGLDHRSPAEYNDAGSRATPGGKKPKPGYLVYRAGQLSSFALSAYFAKTPSLTAYGSENGQTWWPIALASTQSAPALGGHEQLEELLPAAPLPAGTNQLKVMLGPGTELAESQLAPGRSGPACIAAAGGVSSSAIVGVAPGLAGSAVTRAIGVPSSSHGRARDYCVTGGGTLGVVFNRAGVELVTTGAPGYRLGGVAEGATLQTLARVYRSAPLRVAARGLLVSGTGIVYRVKAGRVEEEGVASPALARDGHSLLFALRLAHAI